MKKILILFCAIPFLLLGCSSSNGDNLVTYNNSQLSSDLEKEGIKPTLPTEFPIAITEYKILERPQDSIRYDTNLIGENGEIFALSIYLGQGSYEGELENQEEVKINENEGFYAVNDVTGPSVHWTDGDYHYILKYRTINLETEVNKETMIAIAKSFE